MTKSHVGPCVAFILNWGNICQLIIIETQKGGSPEIAAIVLECGNLPPYAGAIRKAIGLPVFSILDAARLIGPLAF